jgi:hypothetical protein
MQAIPIEVSTTKQEPGQPLVSSKEKLKLLGAAAAAGCVVVLRMVGHGMSNALKGVGEKAGRNVGVGIENAGRNVGVGIENAGRNVGVRIQKAATIVGIAMVLMTVLQLMFSK